LAFVHVTYAVFLLLPLVGFLLARAALERRDLRWIAAALAAVAVPTGAVLLWLLPVARETVSYGPTEQVRCGFAHGIKRYPGQFDVWSCDRFRLAPEVLGRTGAVAVAALVLVPLAALAWRSRVCAGRGSRRAGGRSSRSPRCPSSSPSRGTGSPGSIRRGGACSSPRGSSASSGATCPGVTSSSATRRRAPSSPPRRRS